MWIITFRALTDLLPKGRLHFRNREECFAPLLVVHISMSERITNCSKPSFARNYCAIRYLKWFEMSHHLSYDSHSSVLKVDMWIITFRWLTDLCLSLSKRKWEGGAKHSRAFSSRFIARTRTFHTAETIAFSQTCDFRHLNFSFTYSHACL